MKKNIVLIGMPGAGKSTVGVVLAKMLTMDFVDSDLVIQKTEGRRLSRIIEEEGTEGFIAIENRVNASLKYENTVIATGGSAVYGAEAMQHLAQTGTIVYLKLSYPAVSARLQDLHERGVAMREGQTLQDLYHERCVLYEKYADVTIDEDALTINETLTLLIKALQAGPSDANPD